MSRLQVQLPNSLHKSLKQLAQRDGVSLDQFVATAIAEKIAALTTAEYFEKRAKRGSREKFQRVLDKVPDREPEEFDKL